MRENWCLSTGCEYQWRLEILLSFTNCLTLRYWQKIYSFPSIMQYLNDMKDYTKKRKTFPKYKCFLSRTNFYFEKQKRHILNRLTSGKIMLEFRPQILRQQMHMFWTVYIISNDRYRSSRLISLQMFHCLINICPIFNFYSRYWSHFLYNQKFYNYIIFQIAVWI